MIHRRQRSLVVSFTLALAVLTLSGVPHTIGISAQQSTPATTHLYTVTDLGTLGGTEAGAHGITDEGVVTGDSTTAPGQHIGDPGTHSFTWEDGTLTDLPLPPNGVASSITSSNNAGQVVGEVIMADGTERAVFWQDGGVTDLGTLGGDSSQAIRINASGQIVGLSTTAPGQEFRQAGTHAFLWDKGTMSDLGTLGGEFSRANGINDAGQIVGGADTADGQTHPFLWDKGTMTDLGTLSGFSGGRAIFISNNGKICGFTQDPVGTPVSGPAGTSHAFIYQDEVMTDLGTLGGGLSRAFGINNAGQVVGSSEIVVSAPALPEATPSTTDAPPPQHSFIWENGVMTDLNDLIPTDSGIELVGITVINSSEQIATSGIINGETHAMLLTPMR